MFIDHAIISFLCSKQSHVSFCYGTDFTFVDIVTGRGGALGACAPRDFAINKEVPFSFLENVPFLLRKSALEVSCPPSLRSYVPGYVGKKSRNCSEIFP